jgi:hypothetical protein
VIDDYILSVEYKLRALNLNSTGYPDHGLYGDLPPQGIISMAELGIETGTSCFVVGSSDHQATRLVSSRD